MNYSNNDSGIPHLSGHAIGDGYGTIYGVEPPSRNAITDKVNEIIDELESHRFKSGYLISRFGR